MLEKYSVLSNWQFSTKNILHLINFGTIEKLLVLIKMSLLNLCVTEFWLPESPPTWAAERKGNKVLWSEVGDQNVKNEKISFIHHISVLGGPILASSIASVYCLIPQHNILKEPCYWYEFHLCAGVAVIPFLSWLVHPNITEYWANLPMMSRSSSYIYLTSIGYSTWIAMLVTYHLICDYLGVSHPMPLNFYALGSVTFLVLNVAILSRFVNHGLSFLCHYSINVLTFL